MGTLGGVLAIFDGLARPERFELPTPWFVARYSIQLSYGRAVLMCCGTAVQRHR
jgi:hypothetical protein